jgi:hypothetical protein
VFATGFALLLARRQRLGMQIADPRIKDELGRPGLGLERAYLPLPLSPLGRQIDNLRHDLPLNLAPYSEGARDSKATHNQWSNVLSIRLTLR